MKRTYLENAKLNSYRLIAYLPFVLVTLILIAMGFYTDHLNTRSYENNLRESISSQAGVIRARLEGNINSDAQLVQGLVTAISVEPRLTIDRYRAFAEPLFRGHSHLRNIGAAPDFIIRYMYPVEGNEAAIGLDYRQVPRQYEAVKKARDVGSLVLAGPVNLVQGGKGFIARIPVFLDKASGKGKAFWGIVSAVIDVEKLYQASGLYDAQLNFNLALRGKNALGKTGDVFYGKQSLFESDSVFADITLPYGSWQMAAAPMDGWQMPASDLLLFRAGLVVVGLLILLPLFLLGRFLEKKRASEQRFMHLFNTTPIAMGIVNNKGIITELNDRFRELFGYRNSDLPTLEDWAQRAYPDQEYRQKVFDVWNAEVEKSAKTHTSIQPHEYQVMSKAGELRTVEISGRVMGDSVLATFFDLTERKQAQESLNRFKTTLDLTLDCVFMFDPYTLKFFYINQGAMEQVGYTIDEMLNMTPIDIKPYINESQFHSMIEPLLKGEQSVINFETIHRHKDGHEIPVEIFLQYINPPNESPRFVAIVSDVTKRKQFEQELVAARDQAEKANHAKSEFLSRMSHELRTPMNAILGFSQLLQFEDLSETQRINIGEIYHAGEHLLQLINEILDLAKIEAGRIEVVIEPVSLCTLLEECANLVKPLATTSDISLLIDKSCLGVLVQADKVRLRQALLNLLSNAVKYNRPGGEVSVTCQLEKQKYVRIGVKDTGTGISKEQQKALFVPFDRLGAENTDIEGTGIGLIITKSLIEAMNGEMGIESEPGRGSVFWISLPKSKSGEIKAATPEPIMTGLSAEMAGKQYHLLYVEDNPANLRLVSQLLERWPSIHLHTARTADLGLELIASRHFDLILLDINLQGISGYDVLSRIRDGEATRDIPVIALSAYAMEADVDKGMAAGFDAYLTKPLLVDAFYQILEEMLKPVPRQD